MLIICYFFSWPLCETKKHKWTHQKHQCWINLSVLFPCVSPDDDSLMKDDNRQSPPVHQFSLHNFMFASLGSFEKRSVNRNLTRITLEQWAIFSSWFGTYCRLCKTDKWRALQKWSRLFWSGGLQNRSLSPPPQFRSDLWRTKNWKWSLSF